MQVQDFVIMWRRQNSQIVHMCDPKITNHPKKTKQKKPKQISNINLRPGHIDLLEPDQTVSQKTYTVHILNVQRIPMYIGPSEKAF